MNVVIVWGFVDMRSAASICVWAVFCGVNISADGVVVT
jgi:hypothetical protein